MQDNSAQQDDYSNVSVVTLVPNDKKLLQDEMKLPSPKGSLGSSFPQKLQENNTNLNTQVSSFAMSSEPLRFETNVGKGNKQANINLTESEQKNKQNLTNSQNVQPDSLLNSSEPLVPVSLNVEPDKVVVESTWGKVFQWSTFAFIIGGAIVAGVYYALVVLQLYSL